MKDSNDGEERMPLLHYERLFGSLPRTQTSMSSIAAGLASECTCSVLGKVFLNSSTTIHQNKSQGSPIEQYQPVNILVTGFRDGSVRLMEAETAIAIVENGNSSNRNGTRNPFYLTESNNQKKKPIVAVSVDASGTAFSAIDTGGNCVVWTVKYGLQYRSTQTIMTQHQNTISSNDIYTLTLAQVKTQRWQYAFKEYGVPTCLCLDPAFQHKWRQQVLVAFESGKLVLTSPNWMLQTKHSVLPYTGPITHKDWRGIEALQWRGTILAFCDCSGIKLYDTATLRPIAHVDRPTGARPSLYPATMAVKPQLCMETSQNLLVAWGDLVDLQISDLPIPRKFHVACTMAWRLDCVAAGVVPTDNRHVAVLGLIPDKDGDEKEKHCRSSSSSEVELRIIDRNNGNVVHEDRLALSELEKKPTTMVLMQKNNNSISATFGPSHFHLMSTFAVPRMEDAAELKDLASDQGLMVACCSDGVESASHHGSHECSSTTCFGSSHFEAWFSDGKRIQNKRVGLALKRP